jgi:hypothetical protein
MPVRQANAVWQGNLREGKGVVKLGSGAFEGCTLVFYDNKTFLTEEVYVPAGEKGDYERLLPESKRAGAPYDFAVYDDMFKYIESVENAVKVAFFRLINPLKLDALCRRMYESHLRRNTAAAMAYILDCGDLSALKMLGDVQALTAENIGAFIEEASRRGSTEVLAFLLDYQNNALGAQNAARETAAFDLDGDDDDESDWQYSSDGGDAVNERYTGCDPYIIIPAYLDGKQVVRIGSYAFCNFKGLKGMIVPEGIGEIGPGAFKGCAALTAAKLPESLRHIEPSAFLGCDGLVITAPAGSYALRYAQKMNIDGAETEQKYD